MNAKERKILSLVLDENIAAVIKELLDLEKQLQPITPECSFGDLLRAEMMSHQEVLQGRYETVKKRYNRLKYTKSKCDDEDFGLCEICEDEIALQRLMIMPETPYCVSCANEREK